MIVKKWNKKYISDNVELLAVKVIKKEGVVIVPMLYMPPNKDVLELMITTVRDIRCTLQKVEDTSKDLVLVRD